MNMGVTLLLEMVAIFAIVSLLSFGRLAKWFFKPKHCKILQLIYWFLVIVSAIATVVSW